MDWIVPSRGLSYLQYYSYKQKTIIFKKEYKLLEYKELVQHVANPFFSKLYFGYFKTALNSAFSRQLANLVCVEGETVKVVQDMKTGEILYKHGKKVLRL